MLSDDVAAAAASAAAVATPSSRSLCLLRFPSLLPSIHTVCQLACACAVAACSFQWCAARRQFHVTSPLTISHYCRFSHALFSASESTVSVIEASFMYFPPIVTFYFHHFVLFTNNSFCDRLPTNLVLSFLPPFAYISERSGYLHLFLSSSSCTRLQRRQHLQSYTRRLRAAHRTSLYHHHHLITKYVVPSVTE